MENIKQKKLEELAKTLLKVQRDTYHGRLKHQLLNSEVEKINKEGKLIGISPNEILNRCLQNQDRYEKELETAFPGVSYAFTANLRPATSNK